MKVWLAWRHGCWQHWRADLVYPLISSTDEQPRHPLASALAEQRDLSDLERQGLIQAFEFIHELAWNTLKDFLAARAAFAGELIEDGEAWMMMIEHRNESSHTYNDNVALKIMDAVLTRYVLAFETFQTRFLELENGELA